MHVSTDLGSIEKAAMALAAMGLQPRNYPLHIIANHFRVFVRSCGEYSLAILPLNARKWLNWRRVNTGLSSSCSRPMLCFETEITTCLGIETVELRHSLLSAKWLNSVITRKDPDPLVSQAWIDYLRQALKKPQSLSTFHFPYMNNPVFLYFREYYLYLESEGSLDTLELESTFVAFCALYKANSHAMALNDCQLPTPPQSGWTIAKTLYSLGVPREKLRFLTLWICDYVPYIHRECARCMKESPRFI